MDPLALTSLLVDKKCLVVGDTQKAVNCARTLATQGVRVTHLSDRQPESPDSALLSLQRSFNTTDLNKCYFVYADAPAQNLLIQQACADHHVLCHIATPPETKPTENRIGTVFLVGAGPGEPDLLTIRAKTLIEQADAIVYDRLVSKRILSLCNPQAEHIYAGKAKANHTLPQDSINQLLVDLAQKHDCVVRLKGGDPFIFGRGGEEIETLFSTQTAFEVVPGITAASGCASYAGIPLTHRDHAQSVVFVTGHLRNGKINLNWQNLSDPALTIVVYMGLTGLPLICESLVSHGRSPDTPAALVERGTTENQRVYSSTLKLLPDLISSQKVTAPTLLIIGGVVSLREKLDWFDPSYTKSR